MKTSLLSVSLLALGSCGGGGDSSPPMVSPPPPPPPVSSFDVTGTVAGLSSGDVTVTVNGVATTLAADGSFAFDDIVQAGGDVTVSVGDSAFGQICAVNGSDSFTNVRANISGVSVDCADVPVIRATVQNFFNGDPVTGTDVKLTRDDGGEMVVDMVALDAEGVAAFEVPLNAGRLALSVDPDGFGAQSTIVDTPDVAEELATNLFVQPANLMTQFDNAVGGSFSVDDDVLLELPTEAFVDAAGAMVTGNVDLELTVIDPSQDSSLMPGDFLATAADGSEPEPIESFGAVDFSFSDASGNPVQLGSDKTATIRIPVADRREGAAPASIPLFFYDEDAGLWVEEGSAALTTLASGEQVYEGTVSHFTTWNADRRTETVTARGCVVDIDGNPLAGVRISSEGLDYIGSSRGVSDASGVYTVPMRVSSRQRVSARAGSQSRTIIVTSSGEDFDINDISDPDSCLVIGGSGSSTDFATITLTWGENPRDLDSYFHGRATTPTESDRDFRIAYFNRTETINDTTIFLDVDDTSSFGPEIITVPNFPYEGSYTYSVDLFSGSGTIQNSPARVEVNLGGRTLVYAPPSGTPTVCWNVVRFDVDAAGVVTVEEIGEWDAESVCTSGPQRESVEKSTADVLKVAKPEKNTDTP